MSEKQILRVALIGNPNSGKSTLFNALTGLNQKTGNYAGVTVDKLEGFFNFENNAIPYKIKVLDLPGTYSLHFKSLDEEVAIKTLLSDKEKTDVVVVVLDSTNLKRNLLLATQAIDLGLKTVLVLNLIDEAKEQNIFIDTPRLKELLGTEIIEVDSRNKTGIENLKKAIVYAEIPKAHFIDLNNSVSLKSKVLEQFILKDADKTAFLEWEENEKIERFKKIKYITSVCVKSPQKMKLKVSSQKIDRVLTHPFFGYATLLTVLFVIFQFIFYVAEYPMAWIEMLFLQIGSTIKETFSEGVFRDLVSDGIISGVSGVMMFIPQIALLFLFIALLEDSGYMSRAGFLTDKLMRKVGLNGRSVIPLLSATACAVPSIMSTRTISNFKDRIITIFVLPLVSCSARLPVYTLLISLMFPDKIVGGVFNLKGLALFSLYLLGFIFTFITAFALKKLLKTKEASHYIMEMPVYRIPQLKSVLLTVYNKVKVFVVDAGKIIVAISIVLWFMSNYGPGNAMEEIEKKYAHAEYPHVGVADSNYYTEFIAAKKLEASYIGVLGKAIEPVIRPLGYDWKIGIAIITSFAAREVFVGTMSTIYGATGGDDVESIKTRLLNERDESGNIKYTIAVCCSLLIFYVFAMQCISTIAVVKRETKSWKWPAIQLVYLTTLAYLGAWLTYVLLS